MKHEDALILMKCRSILYIYGMISSHENERIYRDIIMSTDNPTFTQEELESVKITCDNG